MPSERKRLRRENGKIFELVTLGNRLVPYFEALAVGLEPVLNRLAVDEYVSVAATKMTSTHNLAVDWFGVGLGEKVYSRHQVFGQTSEIFPTLRFNRAADDDGEFFSPEEPFKYRIIFRRTSEGLYFEAVERFLEDRFGRHWQGCDSDTSFVILTALGDLLPRLAQQGE
ncbi:MAG: hypothetical protein WAV56_02795 [Microgenomates group bacterium]